MPSNILKFAQDKRFRFIFTGLLSASTYFALSYCAQKLLAWSPFSASNTAYMIAFCGSYTLQKNWTFNSSLPHRRTLVRYSILQVSCSLLTGLVAHISLKTAPNQLFLAVACATVFAGILSYVLSNIWIFNDDSN